MTEGSPADAVDRRPPPGVDAVSQSFWRAAEAGALQVQWCAECARYTWPPTPLCPGCHAASLTWRSVSGRGRVYTACVVREAGVPGFTTPYALVGIELEEQSDLLLYSSASLIDDRAPAIGSPVAVSFECRSWGVLPVFAPTGPAA